MRRVARTAAVAVVLVAAFARPASALTGRAFAATDPRIRYSSSTVVDDPQSSTGKVVVVPTNATMTFWTRGTSQVHLIDVANGAGLSIGLDDRATRFSMRLPVTGEHRHRALIQWGMARGTDKVTVTVTSGALALEGVWLAGGGGIVPGLMEPSTAAALPLVSVFGDSIADGQYTGGPVRNSTGWADVLTRLRRVAVTNQSMPGAAATCWGRRHVADVVARHPDAVVVAIGVNDLARYGCDSSLASFTDALGAIIDGLRSGLPRALITVSAILPMGDPNRAGQVGTWNTAIRRVAGSHDVGYVDPTGSLARWGDFNPDRLHPNTAGHAELAAAWSSALKV